MQKWTTETHLSPSVYIYDFCDADEARSLGAAPAPCSTNVVQYVQKISWVPFDASPLLRDEAFSSYGIELEEDKKLEEGLSVEVS